MDFNIKPTSTIRENNKTQYKKDLKAFESWRKGMSMFVAHNTAEKNPEFRVEGISCKNCEKWRDELLAVSPIVRFMSEKLRDSGCVFDKRSIKCIECDEDRSGGFNPEVGIELCHNKMPSKTVMEDTMAHEMIHAYDHCNFNVNWFNLEHHACTEIRAASLSGDCRWIREVGRGVFGFIKHHQACVKRRAILSVKYNPMCKSEKEAEIAVNKVFKSCFNDTQPFDEIY
ncbi:hypothetical protein BB559_003915 [Furculomyces boomerangus]|uniref:Mitochondrial inner membrane protease ATP23 n=1 Tax=Furculomyces boomerangus TaxID=61424 RepID=A0A2T9YHZ9_9FUNG|nr:hypothetical protein BB559_003915 [Furculomyces boomerangus]